MDIYIVDTNLVFSSILNDTNRIGRFIQQSSIYGVRLYAPQIMQTEIDRHQDKIIHLSGYSYEQYAYVRDKMYRHIDFVEDTAIPYVEFIKAMRIVRHIDPDDVHFVALSSYLDKTLWTGDTQLYKGLKAKGYDKVVMFDQITELYNL